MLPPVFQIALFLRADQIVVAGGGHDRDFHAGLHAGLQIDILVQVHVRPEIHQLYLFIAAPDTVDSPETLDNAHGVPVNIIVDQIIAVLQVLALGYTVCRYQNVNVYRVFLHEDIPVLGNGREAGQYIIEARPQSFCRRFPIHGAGDQSRIQAVLVLDVLADMLIQILRRIRKGRENQHLFVSGVDGMLDLVRYQSKQLLQLCIMLRCYVVYHHGYKGQRFGVPLQNLTP